MKVIENNKNKDINDIYQSLSPESKHSLLDYAEYLSQRDGPGVVEKQLKQEMPRPQDESVVAALKRLNQTYPMIERKLIFHEASSLMTEHIMQGREAIAVIDDLETLFDQHYQQYLQAFEQDS